MLGRGWVVAGGATLLGWAVVSACTGTDPTTSDTPLADAAPGTDGATGSGGDAVAPRAAPGTLLWSFTAGAQVTMNASSIAIAADGSAVVAGTVGGAAVFGETVSPQGTNNDVFLLWLDANGKMVKVRRFPPAQTPHVAATSDGGFVLALGAALTIDGQTGHVLRFDATGAAIWGASLTTTGLSLQVIDVRMQDDRAIVIGDYSHDLSLPGVGKTLKVTASTTDQTTDMFVAALEDKQQGFASSLRSFWGDKTGNTTELIRTVALDANGNIVLAGDVQGGTFWTSDFDSHDIREFDASAGATPNCFFTKIPSQGDSAPSWFTFSPGKTYALGQYDRIIAAGAGTTADGNTWFAGTVMGTAWIGPFASTANQAMGPTNQDIAVVSFDSTGKPSSLSTFTGPGEDLATGFGTTADGVRALIGNYSTGFATDDATALPAVPASGSGAFVNVNTPRGAPFTRSFVGSPTDASNGHAGASALGVGADRLVAAIYLRGSVARSDTSTAIDTASLSVPDAGLTVLTGMLVTAYAH